MLRADVHPTLLTWARERAGMAPEHLARVSKRFALALVTSTLEGNTIYRDAFHLLGVRKLATFEEFGRSVGAL